MTIENYFTATNLIHNISEEEYERVKLLSKVFDAISRTTYQSLYIIDYYKKNFLYVSDNPLFLCGHTSEEVRDMGYLFYIQHVPEKEQSMLMEQIGRAHV